MKKILATILFAAILLSCSLSVNAAGLKDIFSANYYADSYDDLYAAFEYDGTKLFKHVKEYGLKEGRDISPILDVVYYRETYPDLDAAFGDNWDAYVNHYFEYGIKEGRDNGTNFDIIRYVNSYADLREAFDEDYEALAKHYIKYGMKENRTLGLKPQVAPAPQDTVFYEEVTYDADGRVEKVEVYSDSAKTVLVSYTIYNYYSDQSDVVEVFTYNAQDEMTKAEMYQGDIIRIRIIIEDADLFAGIINKAKHYQYDEEGNLEVFRKIENNVDVETIRYYPNGNVYLHTYYDPETEDEISVCMYYLNGQIGYQFGYDENGNEFEKEWDETGNLRYHTGYDENGIRFEKEWDENGNLYLVP